MTWVVFGLNREKIKAYVKKNILVYWMLNVKAFKILKWAVLSILVENIARSKLHKDVLFFSKFRVANGVFGNSFKILTAFHIKNTFKAIVKNLFSKETFR